MAALQSMQVTVGFLYEQTADDRGRSLTHKYHDKRTTSAIIINIKNIFPFHPHPIYT
jgi:hypothetical protein